MSGPHGLPRQVYSLAMGLLQPAYLARLWWRGAREPLYRAALGERFGWYGDEAPVPGSLWIHAVSLGETRAAAALIEALQRQRPGLRLVLTHGTATGRAAGRDLLQSIGSANDLQCWQPWDTPAATRRFMQHVRPAVGVLMETEIWPNLLHAAVRAEVPMVLANARLSPRSAARGDRLAGLLGPALRSLRLVLAQTDGDAQRLRERGASPVEVCGNLKYDMTPDAVQRAQGMAWREPPDGVPRPTVLAASTREGEEPALLEAWRQRPGPRPRLLLVPRHPQRFDEVATMVTHRGFSLARRSAFAGVDDAPSDTQAEADVWLGDSMGEMARYYAAADVALLGGSFEPLGGQNLIEAAACGCPIVMGPHTFNFDEASALALEAGAAIRVTDVREAVDTACALIADGRAQAMSSRALAFSQAHRGAAERMAARILALMPEA